MALTLYYHPLASYCHKVLIGLYENGVDFDKRLVDLGNAEDHAALQALWPLAKFPVLHDATRNRNVPESTVIIDYLDHHFHVAHPLIPVDWEAAQQVRLWDRTIDNYLNDTMQDIVWDRIIGAQGDMGRARASINTVYTMLDQQLAQRTWIGGDTFSLADCAAAPALFFATTLEALPAELAHATRYFQQLMERPSVARTLEEAKPYFSMYPFAEAIPQRFR
jgi:glutathione S-transferase